MTSHRVRVARRPALNQRVLAFVAVGAMLLVLWPGLNLQVEAQPFGAAASISEVTPDFDVVGGGKTITIRGNNFEPTGMVIRFGTVEVTTYDCTSTGNVCTNPGPGVLTVVAPPSNAGNQRVGVTIRNATTPGFTSCTPSQTAESACDFSWGLTAWHFVAAAGSQNGGTAFTMRLRGQPASAAQLTVKIGENFAPSSTDTSVTTDLRLRFTTGDDPVRLEGVTPVSSVIGAVPVVLGRTSAPIEQITLPETYTYQVANLPALSTTAPTRPAQGDTRGGTTQGRVSVIASGTSSGFGLSSTVLFGDRPATGVMYISRTELSVLTPENNRGPVSVQVTNFDGKAGALGNAYTYSALLTNDHAPPTVSGTNPTQGPVTGGTSVVVSGTGFRSSSACPHSSCPVVQFGGVNAPVTGSNRPTTGANIDTAYTQLTVTLPAGAATGPVEILVTNQDDKQYGVRRASHPEAFRYLGAPILSGISPTTGTGHGGTTITVTGSDFVAGTALKVKFGGTDGTGATFVSPTSIQVTTPARSHAASQLVDVQVINGDGQPSNTLSNAFTYTVQPPVSITSVTPSSGPIAGGTTVTITGTGFAVSPAAKPTVTFGGVAAAVGAVTSTSMSVTAPASMTAGLVNVIVTNPDFQLDSALGAFNYIAPVAPIVTSLSPTSGPSIGGTTVTIRGTNFLDGARVFFDVDPSTGANTAATVEASSVIVDSASQIRAVAPGHLPTLSPIRVRVENADGQKSFPPAAAYRFTSSAAPVITSVSPTSGSTNGATLVTIRGSGFSTVNPPTIILAGTPTLVSITSTEIQIRTPVRSGTSPGPVSLTITNPDEQTTTLSNAFTYQTAGAPTISSVSPISGPSTGGTVVTITGSDFVPSPGAGGLTRVRFLGGNSPGNSVEVTTASGVTVVSSTQIRVITPAHATCPVGATPPQTTSAEPAPGVSTGPPPQPSCDVRVTNPDSQASPDARAVYDYLPVSAPTITAVSPTSGSTVGGLTVTITGTNFAVGGTERVLFGGTLATDVTVTSSTSLTAKVPARTAAGAVDVRVEHPVGGGTPPGATLANAFTYAPSAPAVTALSPLAGPTAGGTQITITGTDFPPSIAAPPTVTLGGANAPVVSHSTTQIVVTSPARAAGVRSVIVTNPDGVSSGPFSGFQFVAPPNLGAVTPSTGSAAGGLLVDLLGFQFATTGTVTVAFGGIPSTAVTVVDSEKVTARVPPRSGVSFNTPVSVVVTMPDGQASTLTNGFTYTPTDPPQITGVSPNTGTTNGGLTVTIQGNNFLEPPAAKPTVTFGGVPVATADITVTGATSIQVVLPPRSSPGAAAVVVTNPDGKVSNNDKTFTYTLAPAPSISSIPSSTGPSNGGQTITINGNNFAVAPAGAPTVTVGGVVTPVDTRTATQLTVKAPPRSSAAAVDVVVQNPDGQSTTSTGGYTYTLSPAPTINTNGITPVQGATLGGTAVTIAGTGFAVPPASAPKVFFGSTEGTVTGNTATSISVTTPPGTGLVNVQVVNPDLQTATRTNGYAYGVVITGVTPLKGPATGGTTITINGFGFQSGATITVATGACGSPAFVSSTQMTCVTPPGPAGPVAVTVTNPSGGGTGTLSGAFEYIGPPSVTSVNPTQGSTNGGDEVTVAGTGFSSGATVSLGGTAIVPADVTLVDTTSLKFKVPARPSGGPAAVQVANTDGQASNTNIQFTYQASAQPTITSVNPNTGNTNGGLTVKIAGSNFAKAPAAKPTVTFQGTPVATADITVNTAGTEITVKTPPRPQGAATIVVTNPDTKFATANSAFTYNQGPPPQFTGVTPSTDSTNGGATVTINGDFFAAPPATPPAVKFGGTVATNVIVAGDGKSLQAKVPARAAAGSVAIEVVNPDGQAVTSGPTAFTYTSAPAPQITSLTPATGTTNGGETVTIAGSNFAGLQSAAPTVTFGGTAATISSRSTTQIVVVAPPRSAGNAVVIVTNPDTKTGTSPTQYAYTAAPAPTVTAASPTSGPSSGGTLVTLTGTGFAAGIVVRFGTIEATDVTRDAATPTTKLTAFTPVQSQGPVNIVVQNPDGQTGTLANGYTYNAPPPTVSGVSPNSGPTNGGTSVTITGTNFAAGATVTFGGTAATNIVVQSSTTLQATTPARAAGAVTVVVTTPGGGTGNLPNGYTYVLGPAPTLTSIAPATGPATGGTLVTLTGTNFNTGATVTFGGTAATDVQVTSATQMTARTPGRSPGAVSVVVTNPDAQTATLANGFTFEPAPAPTVASVTPNQGPTTGRTAVTIAGTNFATGATVKFGTQDALSVVRVSATQITANAPANTVGAKSITVTNPDGQNASLANAFTYTLGPAPTLTSLTPTTGPSTGATTVTLTGTNFATSAQVRFDTALATEVTVTSPTTMTARTPAHTAGAVTVRVTMPDAQEASLADAFTYEAVPPPTITDVQPNTGVRSGGTQVTISGTNFAEGANVRFGSFLAPTVSFVSATTLTVVTPAQAAGLVSVTVTNPDLQSFTLANAFTYEGSGATIGSLTPSSGASTGGTVVTLTGSGFVEGIRVSFGGVEAQSVALVDANQLTVVTPPHASGRVDVTVRNPGEDPVTLTGAFTYEGGGTPFPGVVAILVALGAALWVRRRR